MYQSIRKTAAEVLDVLFDTDRSNESVSASSVGQVRILMFKDVNYFETNESLPSLTKMRFLPLLQIDCLICNRFFIGYY